MKEVSAGIILVSGNPKEYLLLHYKAGHWDFAKGKLEKNETAEQAALRETEEETGIIDVRIIPGFSKDIKYFFKRKGETVTKTVTFFLGIVSDKKIKISHEHKGYDWLPYDSALKKATFETAKNILVAAHKFLEANQ